MLRNNPFFSVLFLKSHRRGELAASVFPVIAIPLFVGVLIGACIGMFSAIPHEFTSVLELLQDKSSDHNPVLAAFHSLRFVLSAMILAFTLYGVVFIPVISLLRGFLLGCSVAVVFQSGSFHGLLLAALSIGIPAFFGISAFLLASMDSFCISSSLLKLFMRKQPGIIGQRTVFLSHTMILIPLIAAEAVYSSYILPALLRTVA